jgi:solute carrier family 25 (adenine nucleotide translocator) protein 4/5/6/31
MSKPQQTETEQSFGDKALLFAQDFLMGGTAAGIAKTINAPLERVKLILQTASGTETGLVAAFTKIPREEGFFAYWRGNGTNVLRYFPTQALNFAFKDSIKDAIMPKTRTYSKGEAFAYGLAAGGAAGAASLVFVYSMDLVRTRLSTDMGKGANRKYNGFIDCYKQTWKEGGVRAIYKGFGISVAGIIPYRAVYFGGYDFIKANLLSEGASFWEKWGYSQVNTIIAQYITYPIDTVRRVQMLAGRIGKDGTVGRTYRNAVHCFFVLLKERGVSGIYKGALANTYRATGGALCMVFYEQLQDWLGRGSD